MQFGHVTRQVPQHPEGAAALLADERALPGVGAPVRLQAGVPAKASATLIAQVWPGAGVDSCMAPQLYLLLERLLTLLENDR